MTAVVDPRVLYSICSREPDADFLRRRIAKTTPPEYLAEVIDPSELVPGIWPLFWAEAAPIRHLKGWQLVVVVFAALVLMYDLYGACVVFG